MRNPRKNQEKARGETCPGISQSVTTPEGQLDSWKEIAAYLKRDVTTVQRWEKREGMPVHRHLHDRTGSVYAFRADLDAWARSRQPRAAQENACDAGSPDVIPAQPQLIIAAPQTRWRFLLLVTAGTVLA